MTCARTQGFLAKHKVGVTTVVDARKSRIREKDALALLSGVDEIYAAKGKKVVHLDLTSGKPSKPDVLAVLLGPTGNLRAPTVRKGRTLLVGFDEEAYARLLSTWSSRRP